MASTQKCGGAVFLGIGVVILICLAIMIASIVLGAMNLDHCPVEPYIPIYLIVMGGVSLFSMFLTCGKGSCDDGVCAAVMWTFTTIVNMFMSAWFIAGSFWIYKSYPPSFLPGEGRFCHKVMYNFAFGVTTMQWVLLGLVCLCSACFMVISKPGNRNFASARRSFYGAAGLGEQTTGDV